jgi:hypothetical protein
VSEFSKQFGWLPTLIRIAETGLFNLPNMTPIEAAGEADLWLAFTVLNHDNARVRLDNETMKEAQKERNRKR